MVITIKKESVLILSPFFRPNIGGVETHLDDLCEYLRKSGHKVFVITYQPLTTKNSGQKLEKRENLEVRRIRWFGYNFFHMLEPYPLLEFIYLTPVLLGYSILFLFCHRNEVEVIHAHGLNAAFVSKMLERLFNKKTVVSIHAIYDLPTRFLLSRLLRMVLLSFNIILTLAYRSKKELIEIGLCREKIKVFIYWVDQEIFIPLSQCTYAKEFKLGDKFVVLFVGRLIEKKGIRLLIEVAKRLKDVKICFVFIGDGPLAKELELVSKTLNNVSYKGKIENRYLCQYYNAADLVIMPSLYEEGFGRVILEALSCGTPVMASNRGGILEALDSSVGVFVEPTVYDIERKLRYFYDNPAKLLKLAVNCRKYAEKHFSERNAKIIEASYTTCSSNIT